MFRTLRSRFTAGFVAVIAATVLVLGIGISALVAQVLQDQYAATYHSNATTASVILQASLGGGALQQLLASGQLDGLVKRLSGDFHLRIRVYLPGNSVPVADSGPPAPDPAHHLAVDGLPALSAQLDYYGVPTGSVVVSDPLTDRAYRQRLFEEDMAWIGLGACLLAFLIGGILSARLTAPLRILTRATARMGAGHLAERVAEGRRDEAGELARQFNRMAARLEESFATISADRDHLRQFVGDVSHELRSPLTALRTFNDLLRDGAGADPATRRDFLDESARQIERLDWLTHNLLDLSRLDAGIAPVTPRPADLAETLRRAVETNRPAAAARDVMLQLDAPALLVAHDPPRLEQALSNVISNAVKFSPRGGTVRARLYRDGVQAVAEVSDEGPGILPEEAPHIFERFYRGRAANRSGDGSGLGLAIAKAILDAHRGSIAVDSAPGHGTTMRLSLPADSAH